MNEARTPNTVKGPEPESAVGPDPVTEPVQHAEQLLAAQIEPKSELSPTQERTRKRLLLAAADHFARFGYRRANISEIATQAGVGKGTVYLYFPSKIELLAACIATEKLELIPRLAAVTALPPPDRLAAYLEASIRFAVTAPLSGALIKGDRELSAAFADAEEAGLPTDTSDGMAFIDSLIEAAGPAIAAHERTHLAQVLIAVVALPAHLRTMQQYVDIEDETFITTYARILARGVGAFAGDGNPPGGEPKEQR